LLTADEIGYDLYDPNQRNLDAGSPADSSRETVADLTDLSLGTVADTTFIIGQNPSGPACRCRRRTIIFSQLRMKPICKSHRESNRFY
jgi:hypothetical protein